MICTEVDFQKFGWCISTDLESSWQAGQKFLFLVVTIDRLVKNSDLLANMLYLCGMAEQS